MNDRKTSTLATDPPSKWNVGARVSQLISSKEAFGAALHHYICEERRPDDTAALDVAELAARPEFVGERWAEELTRTIAALRERPTHSNP